jgi:hypothetical protein
MKGDLKKRKVCTVKVLSVKNGAHLAGQKSLFGNHAVLPIFLI